MHVVPVRRDLLDLPEKVRRVLLRPSWARSLARRSQRLAKSWLSHEDAMHYLARLLSELAVAQKS